MSIRTDGDLAEDLEGMVFESLDAARAEAIVAARELMSDRMLSGRPADGSRFEFTDESGAIVLIVPFMDAIEL